MNDSQEFADIPVQPPAPQAAPPAPPAAQPALPAPPAAQPAAQPPPAASSTVPAAAVRVQGLQHRSPFIACVLSIMPGVGQIYVGYYKLGFIHNVVFASTIMILANNPPAPLNPLLGIFLPFFFVYNIVDAGRRASYYNLALDGVEGIELPSTNLSVPSFGGSFAGGLAMIGLGGILLANTLGGVSLDWIEEWWPAPLIALGVYLVWKAIQERIAARRESLPADSVD